MMNGCFCLTFSRDENGHRVTEPVVVQINSDDQQDWYSYVVLPQG